MYCDCFPKHQIAWCGFSAYGDLYIVIFSVIVMPEYVIQHLLNI